MNLRIFISFSLQLSAGRSVRRRDDRNGRVKLSVRREVDRPGWAGRTPLIVAAAAVCLV
jgi:hypothetical protein